MSSPIIGANPPERPSKDRPGFFVQKLDEGARAIREAHDREPTAQELLFILAWSMDFREHTARMAEFKRVQRAIAQQFGR